MPWQWAIFPAEAASSLAADGIFSRFWRLASTHKINFPAASGGECGPERFKIAGAANDFIPLDSRPFDLELTGTYRWQSPKPGLMIAAIPTCTKVGMVS